MKNLFKIIFIVLIVITLTSCNKTYTVKFVDSNNKEIKTIKVKQNKKITLPLVDIPEGSDFLGFYKGDYKWNFDVDLVKDNITLKLHTKIKEYTITFTDDDGEILLTTSNVKYRDLPIYGGITPFKKGYKFIGWDPFIDVVKDDVTYVATYEKVVYPNHYVMLDDEDFDGSLDGEFIYNGNSQYVIIPEVIKGVEITKVSTYETMSNGTLKIDTTMFELNKNIKGVIFENPYNVKDLSFLFYQNESTNLGLDYLDTLYVSKMIGMFYDTYIKDIDVSKLNTNNVIYMNRMFESAKAESINFGNFDTTNVITMNHMFAGTQAAGLDLTSFDVEKVTDMAGMFRGSQALMIDFSSFNTTILQNITSIMLMLFNKSILLVVFVPIIYLPIRSLFLRIYIKKKYPLVDYSVKPSEEKLESRKDAFLSGVSNSLSVSLPIIMVSFLISLEMASVFSIYSMVFMGLTAIISVFRSGMGAVFGNVYAKNEMDIFRESNDSFEFLMYALIAVLYSVALSLITPFIKVYVSDVADINYIYPMVGVLFTIWSIAHNSKTPGEIIIDSTGKWKLARKTYIIQTLMLVLGVFTLGYFFGINGFLIGMIIASLYKSVSIIFIVNSKILKQTSKKTILRFLRMFLIVFMVNIPFIFNLINIEVSGFSEWFFVAIIVFLWGIIITTIINFLFDFETTKRLYHRYIKGFLRKSK